MAARSEPALRLPTDAVAGVPRERRGRRADKAGSRAGAPAAPRRSSSTASRTGGRALAVIAVAAVVGALGGWALAPLLVGDAPAPAAAEAAATPVAVVVASGRGGLSPRNRTLLRQADVSVDGLTVRGQRVDASALYFASGARAEARVLAKTLGIAARARPAGAQLPSGPLVLVIGRQGLPA